MELLFLFIFTFAFAFLGRLILYMVSKMNKKGKKKKKRNDGIAIEIKYLCTKFKLDEKKLDNKVFASIMSFIDALIISGTLTLVVMITDNLIFELFLGLIIVIVLIYVINEILGRILKRKGFEKNGL
jgi:hypothetical protein